MIEARQIDVLAADAVVVLHRRADQFRNEAIHVQADLFGQIAADDVAGVADTVGILARFGVQQDARGIDAGCRDDHHSRTYAAFFFGDAIEVLHAAGAAFGVVEDASHYGVVDHFDAAGLEGRLDQIVGGIEERADIAAFAAGSAVVAGGVSIVRAGERPRGDPKPRDAYALGRFLQQAFAAARRRRRKMEAAAGKRVEVVIAAADADELIDPVVVGRDVFVADGPGDLPAVPVGAGKVEVGVAERDASPDIGLAAASPDPNEVEGLSRQRVVGCSRLSRKNSGGCWPASSLRAASQGLTWLQNWARLNLVPGVQHEDVESLSGKVPGGHPAGCASADDDDVVRLPALRLVLRMGAALELGKEGVAVPAQFVDQAGA